MKSLRGWEFDELEEKSTATEKKSTTTEKRISYLSRKPGTTP